MAASAAAVRIARVTITVPAIETEAGMDLLPLEERRRPRRSPCKCSATPSH